VDQLRVNAKDLDNLKDSLEAAKKSFDTGFDAPRTVGQLPDKLFNTHGVTARPGTASIMTVIDRNRKDVQTHLGKVIEAAKEALENAKKAYLATDETHAENVAQQMQIQPSDQG
jgi:hypothetical protein